ncbi:transcriptional regulator [Abyssogena phaseoliformis symbiont OG214]|uniref:helix-turn-helix domain-containing protein n=1 Tax=Abyssogena phaseoliformis symbiont TaxID=596095 RepID=UPI001916757A|nr:helix-turn-helix transcriptional regulator [Abyssogena phaseoliformis symbiont]MBW5289040.1 transcriptional regulator [Candidatus Ruthia sp. Apha_13_S6]BBB22450.1 transcriptional regulator [Abyssogena phaseoliformis symbiont OG214]
MSKRNPYDERREILRHLLIKYRKNADIKQTQLAQKLNKPQSFVSKYENGERMLDPIEVYEVCNALSISFLLVMKQFERAIAQSAD